MPEDPNVSVVDKHVVDNKIVSSDVRDVPSSPSPSPTIPPKTTTKTTIRYQTTAKTEPTSLGIARSIRDEIMYKFSGEQMYDAYRKIKIQSDYSGNAIPPWNDNIVAVQNVWSRLADHLTRGTFMHELEGFQIYMSFFHYCGYFSKISGVPLTQFHKMTETTQSAWNQLAEVVNIWLKIGNTVLNDGDDD